MLNKYRVHEVAKDFGKNSKEIADVLTKYATAPKNHMQVLEDRELSIIFDYMTQHNQVESIESIYADVYREPKPAPAPAAPKAQSAPQAGRPAQPQQQGGGFMSNMMGAAAGAVAGSMIGEALFGDDKTAQAQQPAEAQQQSAEAQAQQPAQPVQQPVEPAQQQPAPQPANSGARRNAPDKKPARYVLAGFSMPGYNGRTANPGTDNCFVKHG